MMHSLIQPSNRTHSRHALSALGTYTTHFIAERIPFQHFQNEKIMVAPRNTGIKYQGTRNIPYFTLPLVLVLCSIGGYALYWQTMRQSNWRSVQNNNSLLTTSSSKFRGSPSYWKEGVTLSVKTLHETPFARCQIHEVQVGDVHIEDWLWFDECNNINVLIEHESGLFWVLEQTKYAIAGKSFAVMGGMIEPGELPLETAKRELKEELQLESDNWIPMGSYVAASNRGGGTTHLFWARHARNIPGLEHHQLKGGSIAQGELERQDVVQLSRNELLQAVLAGKFQEVKWTATVALALLQESQVESESQRF